MFIREKEKKQQHIAIFHFLTKMYYMHVLDRTHIACCPCLIL